MRKPSQKLVTLLSTITYNNVYLYRYLSETFNIFESIEELENNNCFNAVYPDSFDLVVDNSTASISIQNFLNSLSQKKYLFSSAPLRKPINGELYHFALDPYIDILSPDDYISIEYFSSPDPEKMYSFHTQNIHFYYEDIILAHYGISLIDKEDFYAFLDKKFFSIIEETENVKLYEIQKNNIKTHLFYCLSIRSAYMQFYSDILRIVKPKVICYSHGAHHCMCFLYEVASNIGITCLEIAHGADSKTRFFPSCVSHYTFLITYSDLCSNISNSCGIKNTIAIGKPNILSFGNTPRPSLRTTVVSVISSVEEDLLNIAANLSNDLNPSLFTVIYKRHSAEKWDNSLENSLKEMFPNLTVMNPLVDINELYKISSIIIGERSTALVEALPYQYIKVIIHNRQNDVNFDELGTLGFFNHLVENNEMVRTYNYQDILSEILKYDPDISYRPNGDIFWKKDAENNFLNLLKQFDQM